MGVESNAKPAASGMTATDSQTSATDDSPSQTPEEIGVRQSPVGGEAGESVNGLRPVTPPSSPVDTGTGPKGEGDNNNPQRQFSDASTNAKPETANQATSPIPDKTEDGNGLKSETPELTVSNSPQRQFSDASTHAKPETTDQATSPIPEIIDDKNSLMSVAPGVNGGNTPAPQSSALTDSSKQDPQVTVDSTSNTSEVTGESNSRTPAGLPEVTSPTSPDPEPGELEQYLNTVPVNQEAVQLSGVHQNTVALQKAVNSMAAKVEQFNNWKDAEIAKKEITWLEGEDRKLEPSNTRLRNAIAGQIQTLENEINNTVNYFKGKYGNRPKECQALEERASSIKQSLKQQKESIEQSNRAITGKAVQKWLEDLDKTSANCPDTDDYMEKVLPELASVFASNHGEACSYLAGQTIDRVSRELVRRCNAEVANVPGGKGHHLQLQKLYLQYAQRLQQLDPQRIPARVHQGKLGIRGERFAREAIRQQEAELGKVFGDPQTDAGVLSDTSTSASEKTGHQADRGCPHQAEVAGAVEQPEGKAGRR